MRETASKSGLLLSGCLAWAHPSSRWYSDRPEDAEAREDGKAVHHCLHLHVQGLPYSAPAHLAAKIAAGAKFFDENILPRAERVWSEVVLGINFSTGETTMLEDLADRDYPESDTWFYGTADLLVLLKSGSLLIADWKTGAGDGAEQQLLTLASIAELELPHEHEATKRICRIAPLYITDEEVFSGEREVAGHELVDHRAAMYERLTKARAKKHLPVVGVHCTQLYCPHLAYCSATQKTLDEIANADSSGPIELATDAYQFSTEVESGRHAGWMASRMRAAKRALKFFDGSVRDYVKAGNRATYDGYEYRETGRGFMFVKEKP